MSTTPTMPSRNQPGQLVYASARGGFGVQARTEDLTPEEADVMLAGIDRDRREFGEVIPPFAAPEEVAGFARNLTCRMTPAGLITWLSSPAGTDSSGRPGNVVTHVLLERLPRPAGSPRPVERWRASGWLTPFGSAAVEAVGLRIPFGDDRPVVSRESVIAFITDPDAWRLGALCEILDALVGPKGSAPVVVIASSPDEAALWMGAVSHLVTAEAAQRLSFALWESARGVLGRGRDLDLTFVSPAEAAALRESDPTVGVIDPREEPAPRAWEPHVEGTEERRSPFGPLAVALFSLFDDPAAILAEVERIGNRGLRVESLGWPLAMALVGHLDEWPELVGPVAEALLGESPDDLDRHPDLWQLGVRAIAQQTGSSAQEAWRVLKKHPHTSAPVMDLLRKIHLHRRLVDIDGLVAEAVPVVGRGRWSAWNDPDIQSAVLAGVRRANQRGGITEAIILLRIAEALSGESLGECAPTEAGSALQRALTEHLTPVLTSTPHDLVQAVPALSRRALALIVRPALAQLPLVWAGPGAAPGRRVPVAVMKWLYPSPPDIPQSGGPSDLDVDVAAVLAETGRESPWWPWARSTLVRYATVTTQPTVRIDELLATRLPPGELSLAEVYAVADADPARVSPSTAYGALATLGASEGREAVRALEWLDRGSLSALSRADRDLARRLMRVLNPSPGVAADLRGLREQAREAVDTLARLQSRAGVALGGLWSTFVLLWIPLSPPRAVEQIAAYLVSSDVGDASVAARFLGRMLEGLVRDEDYWDATTDVAALAVQLEPSWTHAKDPRVPLLARCCSPGEANALDTTVAAIFGVTDRKGLQAWRDMLHERMAERQDFDREARKVVNAWFDRVAGGDGLGSKFVRRGKRENEG